jgi:hypothetical protein
VLLRIVEYLAEDRSSFEGGRDSILPGSPVGPGLILERSQAASLGIYQLKEIQVVVDCTENLRWYPILRRRAPSEEMFADFRVLDEYLMQIELLTHQVLIDGGLERMVLGCGRLNLFFYLSQKKPY